jgi:TatD family hydrolase
LKQSEKLFSQALVIAGNAEVGAKTISSSIDNVRQRTQILFICNNVYVFLYKEYAKIKIYDNILIGENMLIDTHCHLDDEKLANSLDFIIENFANDNIEKVITSSSNINESLIACQLADKHEQIYATIGVHPHYADSLTDDVIKKLEQLSLNPKVVAIGEIGLDYYYNICEKNVQIKTFTDQIILADKLNLPVVFHIRDAMGDFINIIRSYKKYFRNGGVVHSFSGSVEIAKELIVSVHTAKAHVCSILQKMCVNDRVQAAVKAVKEGLV